MSDYAEPQPAPPTPDWRDGLCQVHSEHGACFRDAFVLVDGEIVCEGHLRLLWERWQAEAISPGLAAILPPLDDRQARPLPRLPWRGTVWGSPELDKRRAEWRAFQAAQERPVAQDDAERCWAVLSAVNGTRCDRPIASGVLCAGHGERGGLVPGLGWRDGAPQGKLVRRAPPA